MHVCIVFVFLYQLCCTLVVSGGCFKGSTSSCRFPCHCYEHSACSPLDGACLFGCGLVSDGTNMSWSGVGCQTGNVAFGKPAVHTGDSPQPAHLVTNGDLRGSQSHAIRENGKLFLQVDLESNFVVLSVTIHTVTNLELQLLDHAKLYVSDNRFQRKEGNACQRKPQKQEQPLGRSVTFLCGSHGLIGMFVTLEQRTTSHSEMYISELVAIGYGYHECYEFYDGDYWYGPGCLTRCRCSTQCHPLTGVCPTECHDKHIKRITGTCSQCAGGKFQLEEGGECVQSHCPSTLYGSNCNQKCHCNTTCHPTTGACYDFCTSGYTKNTSGVCSRCRDGRWGYGCEQQCECGDPEEVCNVADGACVTGCSQEYIGASCTLLKPNMYGAAITLQEHHSSMLATMRSIYPVTVPLSGYLLQYVQLLQSDQTDITLSSAITINATVQPVPAFYPQKISFIWNNYPMNSIIMFSITPLIQDSSYGTLGIPSEILQYKTGCGEFTHVSQDCNTWCRCKNDKKSFCLLTCEYCGQCKEEFMFPSNDVINISHTASKTSIWLQLSIENNTELYVVGYSTSYTKVGEAENTTNSVIEHNGTVIFTSLEPSSLYTFTIHPIVQHPYSNVLVESIPLYKNIKTADNSLSPIVIIVVILTVVILVILLIFVLYYYRHTLSRALRKAFLSQKSDLDDLDSASCTNVGNDVNLSDEDDYYGCTLQSGHSRAPTISRTGSIITGRSQASTSKSATSNATSKMSSRGCLEGTFRIADDTFKVSSSTQETSELQDFAATYTSSNYYNICFDDSHDVGVCERGAFNSHPTYNVTASPNTRSTSRNVTAFPRSRSAEFARGGECTADQVFLNARKTDVQKAATKHRKGHLDTFSRQARRMRSRSLGSDDRQQWEGVNVLQAARTDKNSTHVGSDSEHTANLNVLCTTLRDSDSPLCVITDYNPEAVLPRSRDGSRNVHAQQSSSDTAVTVTIRSSDSNSSVV